MLFLEKPLRQCFKDKTLALRRAAELFLQVVEVVLFNFSISTGLQVFQPFLELYRMLLPNLPKQVGIFVEHRVKPFHEVHVEAFIIELGVNEVVAR